MKILITGGNGYIARNIKPLFENAGYNVLAPSHSELDILNRSSVEFYLKSEKFDAIIHTATKGGKRTKTDTFEEVYLPNIQMFETLYISNLHMDDVPIILLGSGAEFDRRHSIQEVEENNVFFEWPIDPYGLSKNIIARRALKDFRNMWVLRLFGCFNHDEDPARFIKSSIQNIKNGNPIQIHAHKEMDFFYLDDVLLVMDYILKNKCSIHNINLVYNKKRTLIDIAEFICQQMKDFSCKIEIVNPRLELSYTGNSNNLYLLPMSDKLIGLEEGIKRTINKLL